MSWITATVMRLIVYWNALSGSSGNALSGRSEGSTSARVGAQHRQLEVDDLPLA